MKVSATSHLAIRNRVASSKRHLNSRGRTVTTTSLVAAHSAVKRAHQNMIHESTFSGVPGTLLSSTSSFRARIEAGSLTKIQGGTLRFNITISGAVARLVSPVWFFDRITIFGSGGSKELSTIYDINLFHGLQNLGKDCRRAAGLNDTWCSEDLIVANGQTKDFYLPIASHLLSEIYMEQLKGDIIFHLFPHGNVVADGSGTVTVNSMSFITNTVSLTEQDALVHRSLHKTRILSTHYLEPTRISTNNVTLTRGQEHKESLENFNGAYHYILCGIRATGSATSANDGHSQFVSLGPRGSIDVKRSGNSSLFGSGTPVSERFLRTILSQRHYPNSDLYSCKALYMIPLTDSCRVADIGGRSGCYYFNSERAHLCLTPDAAAPVNQAYTITLSAGLAASYYFQFRGYTSTTLAHNAAVGVMQTTLAAMKPFRNAKGRAPTFVCSATAAAGTSFTISVTCEDCEQVLGNDLISVVTMEAKTSATSLTTIGQSGFTTATYDLVTIGMRSSVLHLLSGDLVTEDA